MVSRVDIVVVGSGPAGSVCASLLAERWARVALVTRPRPRRSWLELLSPEGVLLLESLGFEPSALAASYRSCPGIVDGWHRDAFVVSDFELARCSAGWIVNRTAFDAGLEAITRRRGVRVLAAGGASRLGSLTSASRVTVASATGSEVEAEFVVDATGATGGLTPTPYARRVWFDRLVAVRVAAKAVVPDAEWMRLGYSSDGWWYLLPRSDGAGQAVFMTDADLVPRIEASARPFLARQFEEAFGPTARLEPECSGAAFEVRSARTSCRRTVWSHRWMPVGDAAYTLDPLSGDGIARAVQMAAQTAAAVAAFLSTNRYDELERLAMERVRDFQQRLRELRSYYALSTAPVSIEGFSPFWLRRVAGTEAGTRAG